MSNIPILSALAAGVVSLASFFNSSTLIPQPEAAGNRPWTVIATDVQFNQFLPEIKDELALQQSNHTRRLQAVESALRRHDASWMTPELQAERARNLDRLRDYWQRGEYPINYEHPGAWEPVFIDQDGNICAVGYLVEQSLGRKVAEQINSRYHFATIRQIDAPELKEWIKNSGLTYEEVVAIQAPAVEPRSRIARRSSRVLTEPQPQVAVSAPVRQKRTLLPAAQPVAVQRPLNSINTSVDLSPAIVVAPPADPDTAVAVHRTAPTVAAPGIE